MSQVGCELLKSSRVRTNCTHYSETYESIIQTLPVAWTSGEKGIHFIHSASVLIARPYPFCCCTVSTEITRHFQFSTSDRKHIAVSNRYEFQRLHTSNNEFCLYLYLDEMRLLSTNSFLVCHTTNSTFSAVHLCSARFMKSVQVPMKRCYF